MTTGRSIVALLGLSVVDVVLDALVGRRALVATDGGWQVAPTVDLPAPETDGWTSVEAAIASRRSRREVR